MKVSGKDKSLQLTCGNAQNALILGSYKDDEGVKRPLHYGVMMADLEQKIYCTEEAIWSVEANKAH